MDSIVNAFTDTSNSTLTFVLLCLAVLRFYLEVINFRFERLPIGQRMVQVYGENRFKAFHRYGFYLSLGYFVLFAPSFFLQ